MTATPRFFTGRVQRKASEADFEVASMDNQSQFGPVLHRLTFGQAIDQELLSDYQVVIVGVTDSSHRELAERGAFVTRDGKTVTDARTLASQIAVAKAIRKYDLSRLVSFHGRVSRARAFATSLPDVIAWMPSRERPNGHVWARSVSGQMRAGERDRALGQLRDLSRSERGLLANARCLTGASTYRLSMGSRSLTRAVPD